MDVSVGVSVEVSVGVSVDVIIMVNIGVNVGGGKHTITNFYTAVEHTVTTSLYFPTIYATSATTYISPSNRQCRLFQTPHRTPPLAYPSRPTKLSPDRQPTSSTCRRNGRLFWRPTSWLHRQAADPPLRRDRSVEPVLGRPKIRCERSPARRTPVTDAPVADGNARRARPPRGYRWDVVCGRRDKAGEGKRVGKGKGFEVTDVYS